MRGNHVIQQGHIVPMWKALNGRLRNGPRTALFIALCGMLQACGRSPPVTECLAPPPVDGQTTLTMEDGKTRIKMAGAESLSWTQDCKAVRLIATTYRLSDGQLIRDRSVPVRDTTNSSPVLIPLRIQLDGIENPDAEKLADWQFDAATPHKFYPLVAYFKTAAFPSGEKRGDIFWGVRGTVDPNTGRPYLVGCEIPPIDPNNIESAVESRFHSNGTAKCRGSIRIQRGDRSVSVSIDVYARDIEHITEIYNLVAADFAARVEE